MAGIVICILRTFQIVWCMRIDKFSFDDNILRFMFHCIFEVCKNIQHRRKYNLYHLKCATSKVKAVFKAISKDFFNYTYKEPLSHFKPTAKYTTMFHTNNIKTKIETDNLRASL